jgi:hypothetical protein
MRIHVAIVSEQLLPTVIPCLMARPDRVVLVTSQAMAKRALRLQSVLQEYGIASEIHGEAPDAELTAIRAYASKLAAELAGGEVVFNATGGTKLMTLGFVEVFRERADHIIYTDTAHGRIEVLHDRRVAAPTTEPMQDLLDVPRYLAVQGFRYRSSVGDDPARLERMAARREMAGLLCRQAGRPNGPIGFINALVHKAMDKRGRELVQPVQRLNEPVRGEWRALFDRFIAGCSSRRGHARSAFAIWNQPGFSAVGGWRSMPLPPSGMPGA